MPLKLLNLLKVYYLSTRTRVYVYHQNPSSLARLCAVTYLIYLCYWLDHLPCTQNLSCCRIWTIAILVESFGHPINNRWNTALWFRTRHEDEHAKKKKLIVDCRLLIHCKATDYCQSGNPWKHWLLQVPRICNHLNRLRRARYKWSHWSMFLAVV